MPDERCNSASMLRAPVFPCQPGSKEPATRHGFHDATTDPDRIQPGMAKSRKLTAVMIHSDEACLVKAPSPRPALCCAVLAVYTHCIDGQDDITNRQIERALHARNQAHHQTASGSANRRYPLRSCPPYVRAWPTLAGGSQPRPAHPQPELTATIAGDRFRSSGRIRWSAAGVSSRALDRPDLAHVWPTAASKRSAEPLILSVRATDTTPRQRL